MEEEHTLIQLITIQYNKARANLFQSKYRVEYRTEVKMPGLIFQLCHYLSERLWTASLFGSQCPCF